jgi:hypothetical protein
VNKLSKWLKKYFIPHGENDFKPHFLRHESMLLFLFLVIIVELGFLVQIFIVFDKTNFLASVLPGVLTTLTNKERTQNNAPLLIQNELLTKAAQLKAEDMASKSYFAHTSPEGKTPWYWFEQVHYSYTSAGENLAVNFFESNEVAEAWMNSPTHRANIVKKEFTEIGIGVASGIYEGRNTVFVAQLFGTPIKIIPVKEAPTIKVPVPVKSIPSKTPPAIPVRQEPLPQNIPVVTPPVIVVAPTATQVLGEETDSTIILEKNTTIVSKIKSFIQRALTSPKQSVAYLYGGISVIVILSLLLVLFVKTEIKHAFMFVRGLTLVTIIALLLFINIRVVHTKINVGIGDITANSISSLGY